MKTTTAAGQPMWSIPNDRGIIPGQHVGIWCGWQVALHDGLPALSAPSGIRGRAEVTIVITDETISAYEPSHRESQRYRLGL